MSEREHDEPLSHGAPDEVTLLLGELKEVDPPAGLAGTVMSRISSEAPARVRRLEPVHFRGGTVMAKKVLWSVMGAAAVVLIGLKLAGYPPPSEGTEGTIGAAQRYQSQQIADADVKVTDAELQKFMQSDVFHKLINDKAARRALANKDVQKALADPNVRLVLASDQVRFALADEQVRFALVSDEARKALASEEARKLIASDAVRLALADDQVRFLLANDQARFLLTNDAVAAALAQGALVDLLAAPGLVDMLAAPGIADIMAAPGFTAALEAAAQ